jgi:hypothetical protein
VIPGSASPFFLGSSLAVGGGGAGYQVERSLRFSSSDSAFLSRTPAVAGNRNYLDVGGVGEEEWTNGVDSKFFGPC